MAQALQVTRPTGEEQIIPISDGVLRVDAFGGASYRLIDTLNPDQKQDAIIRRVGDDLLIDVLAGNGDVLLVDYFFICELDYRGCAIELESIGGAPGELLTPGNADATQLADGSALLWTTPPTITGLRPVASAPEVASTDDAARDDSGGGFSWPLLAAGLGGLAVAGAAAGGGGGGDDSAVSPDSAGSGALAQRTASIATASSDAPAPVDADGNPGTDGGVTIGPGALAPGAQTNDSSPSLSGTMDMALAAGERLAVYRNGNFVGDAQVDGTTWSFTDQDVPSGRQSYTVRLLDSDGGRSPLSDPYVLEVDGTAPTAPVLAPIAGDNVLDVDELAAGLEVSGSAEANALVTASWGDVSASGRAGADGRFTLVFATDELPSGAVDTIEVTATDSFGNTSEATTQAISLGLSFDETPPVRPTITAVGDTRDVVDNASAADGVQIWGKAEAHSTIRITWGEVTLEGIVDRDGDYQLTFDLVPVANGRSSISVVSIDPAGNVSETATASFRVNVSNRYRLAEDDDRDDADSTTVLLKADDLLEADDGAALFQDTAEPAQSASVSGYSSPPVALETGSVLNLTLQSAENPLL